MITKLAAELTDKTNKHLNLCEDETEVVKYGLFSILSKILYFLISIIAGCILNCLPESCIFYFTFVCIRKHAGGYHAKSEKNCIIISVFSVLACVYTAYLCKSVFNLKVSLFLLSVISVILIIAFSPIDTIEHPLNRKTKRKYKKITAAKAILFLTCSFIMLLLSTYLTIADIGNIASAVNIAIILEGVLLTMGKVKQISVRKLNPQK